MNNDLISRSALLDYCDAKAFNALELWDGGITRETWLEAFEVVRIAPAVDAEPVRHGRWIWADDGYLRCSLCEQKAPTTTQYQEEPIQTATDYCPNCGAKMMDGDVNA